MPTAPGRSRARGAHPPSAAQALLRRELADDGLGRDITTRALLPSPRRASAVILPEAPGVLSGGAAAARLARSVGLSARLEVRDGGRLRPGRPVLRLSGDLATILGAERTILNTLMHLSGVATATAAADRAVRIAGGTAAIFATRKTLPGLRDLEKAAVVHGGGHPHRRDLSDGFLAKGPHLAGMPVAEAVRRLRAAGGRRRVVEVEVGTATEAVSAARAGANALLLDNTGPAKARRIIEALRAAGVRDRVWVELSGGITPRTAGRYARCGADALSLGSITHSAPAVPFHLRLVPPGARPPA